jgi:hypothetical protein
LDTIINKFGEIINQLDDKIGRVESKVNNIMETMDQKKEKSEKGWLTEVVRIMNIFLF